MSIFGNSGGGGGITPEQLDLLVSDPELSAAQAQAFVRLSQLLFGTVVDPSDPMTFTPIASAISALSAAAAAPSGLTVLMTRADGQASAGYSRVSGVLVPSGLYGQQRFLLTNFTSPNASSENRAWTFSASAGGSRYWDIGTGANTTIANWPGSVSNGIGSVSATDEFGYTIGGSSQPASQCFRFTAASNAWSGIANLPASRFNPSVANQADGRVLAVGGSTVTGITAASLTDTVYRYEPSSNTWPALPALPFRVAGGYSTRLSDGRIFFIWSQTSDGTALLGNRAAIFTPSTTAWEVLDSPPYAGPCYQDSNGNVVVLSLATPGNAQTYNGSLPSGSRWLSTPYTAPTGATSFTAPMFIRPMAGGTVVPVTISTANSNLLSALFTVGTLTNQAGAAFYATKD